MDTAKTQIIDRLKQATNVLVTVSANPSVDQLASAIGITLLLNKLGKHATAVYSGQTPSTIEFLKPEDTLEKTTDSLRDFIIALDKSKADKLRYKVEDQMVKIFITPYRTSITDKDLEFSQGDFNVEAVLAIGVNEQKDLDTAITSHGRILHDATVIGINTHDGAELGSINWARSDASSLSEMLLDLGLTLKADVLDGQMATAFLTGIVAETERFSNEKTSSETMQLSAKLMAAGANQQLVASQLQPPAPEPSKAVTTIGKTDEPDAELPEVAQAERVTAVPAVEPVKSTDGALKIEHEDSKLHFKSPTDAKTSDAEDAEEKVEQIHIDDAGHLKSLREFEEMNKKARAQLGSDKSKAGLPQSRMVLQPPVMGGKLTANSEPEKLDPSTDPLGAVTSQASMLTHETAGNTDQPKPHEPSQIPKPAIEDIIGSGSESHDSQVEPNSVLDKSPNTLEELEKAVDSPHIEQKPETFDDTNIPEAPKTTDVNLARDAVMQAVAGSTQQVLEPVQSLNAQPMDLNLGDIPAVSTSLESAFDKPSTLLGTPPPATSAQMLPIATPVATNATNPHAVIQNPTSPPPVPPPMMPPTEQGDAQSPLVPPVL